MNHVARAEEPAHRMEDERTDAVREVSGYGRKGHRAGCGEGFGRRDQEGIAERFEERPAVRAIDLKNLGELRDR